MSLTFRDARARDLSVIVAMLADDALGRGREKPQSPEIYSLAFGRMEGDVNNRVIVAEQDGRIVGCFQITFIQGLSRAGARRALVEGVRTSSEKRGQGIGEAMMRHAVELARDAGCALVQLTSDKSRTRAHDFYVRLGFEQSHEGFKLDLK
ncbi:MAG: N-acetyltransferase family protein [Rhizomicrobium sp.]